MKTKILCMFLIALLVFASFPFHVSAVDEKTLGDVMSEAEDFLKKRRSSWKNNK